MAEFAFVTKRVGLSCLHQLQSPDLSEKENLKIFGKCYKTHGHDYYVEATIKGVIDPQSGLACNRDLLDERLESFRLKYDKTNLNDSFSNTTGEILACEFFKILERDLKPLSLHCVRLQETPKNFFYFGTEEFFRNPLY